jgi:hypothetical protein
MSLLPELRGLHYFAVSHAIHPQKDALMLRFSLDPSRQLTIALGTTRSRKRHTSIAEAEQELMSVRATIVARQAALDGLAPGLRREVNSCMPPQPIDPVLQKLLKRPGAIHTMFPNDSPQHLCIPGFEKQVPDPDACIMLVRINRISSNSAMASLPRVMGKDAPKLLPTKKLHLLPESHRFPLDVVQALSTAMANQQDVALTCFPLRDAITDAIVGARIASVLGDERGWK